MPRIAIVTDDPGWHGARLRESFQQHGFDSQYVSLTDCQLAIGTGRLPVAMPGFQNCLPDGVFVRGVPGGTLDEVVFYLDILHSLKALGVPVYNDAKAVERSVDKAFTSFTLNQAGLPTPPTWVVRDRLHALAIVERELNSGHQIVSKPLFGSQGIGIARISKIDDVKNLVDNDGIYYLQRFIESSDNLSFDWRVFVIDGVGIAAMRRVGDGWLNNVAQGARCEAARLDKNIVNLAESAVKALEMDYGGADIIRDKRGNYQVIEVNSVPAWKGLQGVADTNIADLLAVSFLGQCRPEQEGGHAVSWT